MLKNVVTKVGVLALTAFIAAPAFAQEATSAAEQGSNEITALGLLLGGLVTVCAGVAITFAVSLKGMQKTKTVINRV